MKYLPYYILVIVLVLLLAPPMKRAVKKSRVESCVVKCNTFAFREGVLVVLENNTVRIALLNDTAKIIGVVTKSDTRGEITVKYSVGGTKINVITTNTERLRTWLKTPHKGVRMKVFINVLMSFVVMCVVLYKLPSGMGMWGSIAIMAGVFTVCYYLLSKILIV